MWPLLVSIARANARYILFPVAFVAGVIGFNIESFIRRNQGAGDTKSIADRRLDRILEETEGTDLTNVEAFKDRTLYPNAVLEKVKKLEGLKDSS